MTRPPTSPSRATRRRPVRGHRRPRRPVRRRGRRGRVATSASRGRTWSANHAPKPAGGDGHGAAAAPAATTGTVRETVRATTTRARRDRGPADPTMLAMAATSAPMTSTRAMTPAGPDPRIPSRASARAGSGAIRASVVSARPSRCSPPLTSAARPDGGDGREDRLRRRRSRGPATAASRPIPAPTSGKTAARPAARRPRADPDRDPGQQARWRRAGRRRARSTPAAGPVPGRPRRPTGSRASSSVVGRRPVGDDPAVGHDARPAVEEVGREGEIVEHGEDRRPVALVEVDEELHDLDLVADVEVRGRLVEDEDRRRLGEGQGDEHELPLARSTGRARRDRAGGAMPDPLDRGVDRRRGPRRGGRSAAARAAAGRARRHRRRASRTAAGPAPGRRRWSARRAAVASQDRHRRPADVPAPGSRTPGQAAQQRRLAGAVRSDERDALAGLDRRGRRRRRCAGSPWRRPAARRHGSTAMPVATLTARTPSACAAAGTGRTARRGGPSRPRPGCRRPGGRRGPRRPAGRPRRGPRGAARAARTGRRRSRTTWGTTRPTKPISPLIATAAAVAIEARASRMPRSRPTSMPRWRAAASPSSIPSSDAGARHDQRRTRRRSAAPRRTGAARTRRRGRPAGRRRSGAAPSRTRTSPWSAGRSARERDGVAGQQQAGQPARPARAAQPEDDQRRHQRAGEGQAMEQRRTRRPRAGPAAGWRSPRRARRPMRCRARTGRPAGCAAGPGRWPRRRPVRHRRPSRSGRAAGAAPRRSSRSAGDQVDRRARCRASADRIDAERVRRADRMVPRPTPAMSRTTQGDDRAEPERRATTGPATGGARPVARGRWTTAGAAIGGRPTVPTAGRRPAGWPPPGCAARAGAADRAG